MFRVHWDGLTRRQEHQREDSHQDDGVDERHGPRAFPADHREVFSGLVMPSREEGRRSLDASSGEEMK